MLKLSAAGSSDPDCDKLTFHRFVYPEVGTYGKSVPFTDAATASPLLTIPADAVGKTIHVILKVTDSGNPGMTRYRRAVLSVGE